MFSISTILSDSLDSYNISKTEESLSVDGELDGNVPSDDIGDIRSMELSDVSIYLDYWWKR